MASITQHLFFAQARLSRECISKSRGAEPSTKQKLTSHLSSSRFMRTSTHRQGFALDYKLDVDNLTLSIGSEHVLPIINNKRGPERPTTITEKVDVSVRIGDMDGANLPWFPFADSVLLFWWIEKEDFNLPLLINWENKADGLHRMELLNAAHIYDEPLLAVEIRGEDTPTISVSVPKKPLSSSPSLTYPVRVAIIHVIAPTALFVSDLFGNAIGVIAELIFTLLFTVFVVFVYAFLGLAVVFSLWRCFSGPSFEDTVEGIKDRLQKLSENERLQFLKIDALRENLDFLIQNEKFKTVVYVCRNGWHPERDRERAAEEGSDIEEGLDMKVDGEGDEGERASSEK
jgi:hypothetical protein